MNAHKHLGEPRQKPLRRVATEVALDEKLVAEAAELGVDLASACEAGLAAEVREAKRLRWVEENWDAIQSSNAYVEKHGLPLAKYRRF